MPSSTTSIILASLHSLVELTTKISKYHSINNIIITLEKKLKNNKYYYLISLPQYQNFHYYHCYFLDLMYLSDFQDLPQYNLGHIL